MNEFERLEKEISDLQLQMKGASIRLERIADCVSKLKKEETDGTVFPSQPNPQPQPQILPEMQPQAQPYQQPQAYRKPQTYTTPVYQQYDYKQPSYDQPAPQPQEHSFSINESWVGTHLMGIAASVLVFISLVLFAKLLIPYLGDTLKVVLMFAGSAILTAIGYILHKKNDKNTFFSALFACGEGCLYLSIVVTRAVFGYINDIEMYIALLIWGLIVVFIEKKKSLLFQIIADLGFLVSIFFAVNMSDVDMFLPMVGYILLVAALYQFVFRKDSAQSLVQGIANELSLFAFTAFVFQNCPLDNPLSFLIIAILSVVFLAAYIVRLTLTFKENRVKHCAFALVDLSQFMYLVFNYNDAPFAQVVATIGLSFSLIAGIVYELNHAKRITNPDYDLFNAFWTSILAFVVLIYIADIYEAFFKTGILFIAIIPMMIHAYYKNNITHVIQSWGLALLLLCMGMITNDSLLFSVCAFCFFAFAFVVEAFINNTSAWLKIIGYIILLGVTALLCMRLDVLVTSETASLIMYAALTAINTLMFVTGFHKRADGSIDINTKYLLYGVNYLLLLGCLIDMFNTGTSLICWGYIVLSALLATLGIKDEMQKGNGSLLFAGCRYGIVLLCALLSNDAPNYVLSVVILVFSIVCIILGFYFKDKGKMLRIFGLVLSMICVAKFIMIDITYENNLGHAISFLISGIICFAISAIYNHFEKLDKNTV